MSKDKYLGIFLPQMMAVVLIILQIFYATLTVLKIGECSRIFLMGNTLSHDLYRPISCEQIFEDL